MTEIRQPATSQARRTAAGEVVELWQSEDPPMTGRALAILPWETTTDTVVSSRAAADRDLDEPLRGRRHRPT